MMGKANGQTRRQTLRIRAIEVEVEGSAEQLSATLRAIGDLIAGDAQRPQIARDAAQREVGHKQQTKETR